MCMVRRWRRCLRNAGRLAIRGLPFAIRSFLGADLRHDRHSNDPRDGTMNRWLLFGLCIVGLAGAPLQRPAAQGAATPRAFIDGSGPGWKTLTETDFAGVNGNADTWTWK